MIGFFYVIFYSGIMIATLHEHNSALDDSAFIFGVTLIGGIFFGFIAALVWPLTLVVYFSILILRRLMK
jgi:hypothetical protein